MEDDNIDNADDNSNEDDSGRHTDAAQNHAARYVATGFLSRTQILTFKQPSLAASIP